MKGLFTEFPKSSLEEWKAVLTKELKGGSIEEQLTKHDLIEELSFESFAVESSQTVKRSISQISNDWVNYLYIQVNDPKEANQFALEQLMKGASGLIFDLVQPEIELNQLIQGIDFEFIETTFIVHYTNQLEEFDRLTNLAHIQVVADGINRPELINEIVKRSHSAFKLLVDGYSFQQTGATIQQQIAFALSTGNEYLYLIKDSNRITFFSGIGANYFNEISKIRAFKNLWESVVSAHRLSTDQNSAQSLIAFVGLQNKSLKDPYTNILRQTTEVMSAVTAGVNGVSVIPYDYHSMNGVSSIAQRMSLNISLILQEESYFNYVLDPIGGSYSVEALTEQIEFKSWALFQWLDDLGGTLNEQAFSELSLKVKAKVQLKLSSIEENKTTLIGINKFPNPVLEQNDWKDQIEYKSIPLVVFERDKQL